MCKCNELHYNTSITLCYCTIFVVKYQCMYDKYGVLQHVQTILQTDKLYVILHKQLIYLIDFSNFININFFDFSIMIIKR